MSHHGELPPFDVIISADTQGEPDEVYETVEWVSAILQPYLHRSMIPLPLAPIDEPETGQEELFCFACNT